MLRTTSQGTSEIRLHLQPENLGDITMKISVNGNQISANVIAANADVRSALQSGQQQLAKSLANSGLTLSGFSVDVSGGDARRDQSQGRASGFGRRYVIHEMNAKATDSQPISNLGPALLSGAGLELFNYLV
jgi:flagellar hook-length control protein FliK